MKHFDSINAVLTKHITELEDEITSVRAVLQSLSRIGEGKKASEPKKHRSKDPRYKKRGTGVRIRRVRYKVNCTRCGKEFFYQRDPDAKDLKKRSKNLNHFCGKPCYSGLYHDEQRKKKEQYQEKYVRKGIPLITGDPISAAHN